MTEPGAVGMLVDVEVGPVAHGGHCVARHDGRVVFVRHALPGERVVAQVTERSRGFLRADAIEVLRPSPDRVDPPCPYARPGGCGGCDFQHATPAAQRVLKADVVREQLARLAGLRAIEVEVSPLPDGGAPAAGSAPDGGASAGGEGLGWRTRMRFLADPDGRLGLRRHRSHQVMAVERCRIAHPAIQRLGLGVRRWPAGTVVTAVMGADGEPVVLSRGPGERRRFERVGGPPEVTERAAGRSWTISPHGFWQVHPAAADVLAATVTELLDPRPGERAWDLYSGAGLFAAALAARLGDAGRITAVEGSPVGAEAARRCLADLPGVRVVAADVAAALANPRWRAVDLVVVDPPRTGLGPRVVQRIVARGPRAVGYVSCDPATFARDVAGFAAGGYRLARLRAFDAFPMTHHVEVVGLLTPAGR